MLQRPTRMASVFRLARAVAAATAINHHRLQVAAEMLPAAFDTVRAPGERQRLCPADARC